MARHYGLFAVNATGKSAFDKAPLDSGDLKISAGETLTFQCRILFLEDAFNSESIDPTNSFRVSCQLATEQDGQDTDAYPASPLP
ncbi:MAG: hypothetical protein ACN4GF_01355 [Lentimonas sp.]